ncbi:hypothetical protein ACHAXS_006643 [Conticribra weissflogii]
MVDNKPKVEGADQRSGRRKPSPYYAKKKEYKNNVPEIEDDTFDCGDTKYAAKFIKSKDNIANYLQRTTTYGGLDIGQIVREMKKITVTMPEDPDPSNRVAFEKWRLQIRKADKQQELIDENVQRAFAVVYNQCSPRMKTELKGLPGIEAIMASQDVVKLLAAIRAICTEGGGRRHNVMTIVQANKKVDLFYQRGDQSNDKYVEELSSLIKVVESHGGQYGYEPGIPNTILDEKLKKTVKTATTAEVEEAMEIAKERFTACLVLNGADNGRYKQLKDDLHNQHMMGTDNYPKTVEHAVKLLNNYKTTKVRGYNPRIGKEEHVAMIQYGANEKAEKEKKGKKKKKKDEVECFRCGELGHYASECNKAHADSVDDGLANINVDSEDDDYDDNASHGMQALMIEEHGISMLQARKTLNPNHFYVDTCATYSSSINKDFLSDIHETNQGLHGHCNAESIYINKKGKFGRLDMWFNPTGIANLISFHRLEKLYNISYSTIETDKCFIVHTPEGDVKFKRDRLGLPYIDGSEMLSTKGGLCLINTICNNYKGYSQRQIRDAEKACEAMAMVGHPTEREFTNMVHLNMIQNCKVTPEAITNAFKIFGPDLEGVRGKTVQRKPQRVMTEYVAIPRNLMELHKYVDIAGDVMFVNGVPHLVTASQGLNLTTVEYLETRTATQLGKCLLRIAQIYSRGGFISTQ